MTKKSKNSVWIIIAVVAVIMIGLFMYRRWKAKKALQASSSQSSKVGNDLVAPVLNTNDFPLKYGSRGDNVKRLQEALNKRFNAGLEVDGIFGMLTERALTSNGLELSVTEQKLNELASITVLDVLKNPIGALADKIKAGIS